jgi:ClpP class serine protease
MNMQVILLAHDIDIKASNEIERLLCKAQEKNIKEIIFILDTFGGYEFAVSRIINSIQNYPGKIYAYVPRYSMSAGSLIALACDKIYMNKTASLGSVDPQMGILFWVHSSKAWREIINKKGSKADDQSIAMGLYAEQYTKLIRSYLDKIKGLNDKPGFKDFITNGDIPHSQQLGYKELEKWGIKVKDIMPWEINHLIEKNPKAIKATF